MKLTRKMERAVVAGMGVASPLGCSIAEFWDGLLAGKYETQNWPSLN
jgi:3-oxoacyl-(acyl-carrier-protein) synthase